MRSVGLKVLKNKLSEYVRLAASGETVLISDHDRVVAELVPPRPTRADSLPDALLAEAVRNGLVTPPVDPHGSLPETVPLAPLSKILEGIETDRADR
ncbi:MAG: prevent-host-death protein [Actinomycetota bacterium]